MIRINDVVKIEDNRKRIRKEIYTKIYEQFSSRIKQASEYGRKEILATVPMFLLGYPMFDRDVAVQYITRQFIRGGFTVHVLGGYDLYISWDIPKKKREREREPEEASAEAEVDLPNLMNLKKMANKYRKGA